MKTKAGSCAILRTGGEISNLMPENDSGRNLRSRSAKLISYPIDFLMRGRAIVKFQGQIYAPNTSFILRNSDINP